MEAVGAGKCEGSGEAGNIGAAGSERMLEDIDGIERCAQDMARIDDECGSESMGDHHIE
jgi:hypothetical protein